MPDRVSRKGANSPRFLPFIALLCGLVFAAGCSELRARQAVKDGNKLYSEGRYEQAIERFQAALTDAPQLEIAHHNLALAHLKLFRAGDADPANLEHARQALENINAYLAVEPDDGKMVNLLIKTYVDAEDYDGAINYWTKHVETHPTDQRALGELAGINETALRYDEALLWHRKRFETARNDDERVNALFAVGNLQNRRLIKAMDKPASERLAMADSGIGALQQASAIQPDNEQIYGLLDALYRQRAVSQEVSWARAVEEANATMHRLHWRDIYLRKKKEMEQKADDPATESDQAGTDEAQGG
jgi:tetratricopeptide (TPR) repeat protein